jgi:hypothetical protein
MGNSSSDRGFKSSEEKKREREQRARDERAEASREYLADIAINGSGCDDD